MLIAKPIGDIDVTTAANPDMVMELFKSKDIHVVPTGYEHGTVTILLGGESIEVTTFRKDVSTDGRRSTVEFGTSLEEDLLRRDFTINAIAYCPIEHVYIDPYGGREDLKRKTIRAVGLPIERFREDYLRMIRAHRFAATLGFAIEPKTLEALDRAAKEEWYEVLSVERIRDEFNKCFRVADTPSIMLDGMRASGLLHEVMLELLKCVGFEQNRFHDFDLYEHTLRSVDAVPKEKHHIRWAALFHDLGKVETCEGYGPNATFYCHEKVSAEAALRIMRRLKFSNKAAGDIVSLVKCHMLQYSEKMRDASVRKIVAAVGEGRVEDLCTLWYADRRAKRRSPETGLLKSSTALLERLEKMSADEKVFKLKDLAIGGREIMEIKKIPPSAKVGEVLQALYELVIEDTSVNTNEQLREIAERI
ncbi:MAG: HDIG domain-containing protein [Proteobacteria bacterium]|nr:HDIG domain-containing protein [Pseudomonadota bacterium]